MDRECVCKKKGASIKRFVGGSAKGQGDERDGEREEVEFFFLRPLLLSHPSSHRALSHFFSNFFARGELRARTLISYFFSLSPACAMAPGENEPPGPSQRSQGGASARLEKRACFFFFCRTTKMQTARTSLDAFHFRAFLPPPPFLFVALFYAAPANCERGGTL